MTPVSISGSVFPPGLGPGWTRVAEALANHLEPTSIEGIWLFPPVRRDEREWGVALVTCRSEAERRRIFTASYMIVMRGRKRGHGKIAVEEVGESPPNVLEQVIRGVLHRSGDTEPPVEISPDLWYGARGNGS